MTHPALLVDAQVVHAVLPNMGLACGRDLVEVCDDPARLVGQRALAFGSDGVTCPECLEQPIRDLCEQQQRRQA